MIRQDDKINLVKRYPAYGLQQKKSPNIRSKCSTVERVADESGVALCPTPSGSSIYHMIRCGRTSSGSCNQAITESALSEKRNILIERFPDGRPASLYRIFTTDPIERGGSDTLLFRRVPDRLSSEKGWIRISHHIDAIQIGGIKEIIHQSMMIRMQACRHTVMVRESHTRESWDEKQPSPQRRPMNRASAYVHATDNPNENRP